MLILPLSVFAVAGSITGRVTDGNNSIAGGIVSVYCTDGSQILSVNTDTNGYYAANGISSGTYKVLFFCTFMGYFDQWFSNKSNFTSADADTVNAPDSTSGIDAVLIAGGAIVGTVTDGTTPIPNISVWVYDNSCGVIEEVSTNYNGKYALGGIPSVNYKAFFFSGSSGFNSEWYNNKGSCAAANPIAVTAPNTTSSIDAVLIRTGGLAVRVTDGTNGIYRVVVAAYDSSCDLKATAVTNLNGDYAIGGLPAGSYKVYFSGGSSGFMSEW